VWEYQGFQVLVYQEEFQVLVSQELVYQEGFQVLVYQE
jgi:hypothetical protein